MKVLLVTVTVIFFAAALMYPPALTAQSGNVVVHDAWLRVPLPAQDQTALYFVIENHGSAARAIVSASSPAAAKIELHEEKMEGDKKMMSMTPIARIPVAANGMATLKPGGFHMMVFGLKSRPMAGSTFPVTVTLDDGTRIEATAMVRDSAGDSMNMKK